MVAALYQNFVVNGFSVEGEQLKRYEQGQSKLAGILGLEADVKMKVRTILDFVLLHIFFTVIQDESLSSADKIPG